MPTKKSSSRKSPKAAKVDRKLGGRPGKDKSNPNIKGGPSRPGPGVSKI
jgi:hypothetical protein